MSLLHENYYIEATVLVLDLCQHHVFIVHIPVSYGVGIQD